MFDRRNISVNVRCFWVKKSGSWDSPNSVNLETKVMTRVQWKH